ncbi:MAG: 3'-5' exonuclease [Saprospiraceae bacterium]|nr:3'-5' exonuclease [Saprospiraceae bacterium]
MIDLINITDILFFDIETVPATPQYSDLNEKWQELWHTKAVQKEIKKPKEDITEEDVATVYERAGIYAEFGKICCISVGVFYKSKETGELKTRLKSYASDDEGELLRGFVDMLTKSFNFPERQFLCGHNIKEFDVPYICRRLLVHQIPFPRMFDITGKKPWETKHLLDTMELWKFGDNKSFTSIKLLTALFDIPSPKEDIDGSQVARVFYEEGDIERIARYCEKDVVAVMQLMLRYKRMSLRLTVDGDVITDK